MPYMTNPKIKNENMNYNKGDYALEYINLNYKEVDIANIKIGNIIAVLNPYSDKSKCSSYNIQHFGKIVKTDNTISGTIIRSKWGQS